MDYIPNTEAQLDAMLRAAGVESFSDLIASIPARLREPDLALPEGLTEAEVLRAAAQLGAGNEIAAPERCFLGAGAYRHAVPSALDAIACRGEWLTPYTPYQAEASQGLLQMIFEFQSMVAEIFAMDIANASLYDGASAAAEAVLLAARATGRKQALLSEAVHPHTRQVIHTYLQESGIGVQLVPCINGVTDIENLAQAVSEQTACVLMQQPNVFGCLEPMSEAGAIAHRCGGLFVASVYPMSLGLLRPPGEYDADIAVGEGSCFGTPVSFGGPGLGLFTAKEALLRRLPGRLVGETVDKDGKRAFTLTLQTREQHIRREKATSNVCTNQGWVALRATLMLSLLGPEGLREAAENSCDLAHALHAALCGIKGLSPAFDQPFFNEFALKHENLPMEQVSKRLRREGFLGGWPLRSWYPHLEESSLWCATEGNTRDGIDALAAALGGKR